MISLLEFVVLIEIVYFLLQVLHQNEGGRDDSKRGSEIIMAFINSDLMFLDYYMQCTQIQ